ncbi:MAG: disulfide bond formation protein B [Alphaproteobacteria bacterium]|nr:disulfide bond formation protein B [Alphaproteobacteria bacterium]
MVRIILNLYRKIFSMPWAALVIFTASALSMASAYILQFFFSVQPCALCLYQRVPFAVAVILTALAIVAHVVTSYSGVDRRHKIGRFFLALCAAAFLINTGIAIYHTGVEFHWWAQTDLCGVNPNLFASQDASVESIRNAIMNTPVVPCDVREPLFFGMTIANGNIFLSLALSIFAFWTAFFPPARRILH